LWAKVAQNPDHWEKIEKMGKKIVLWKNHLVCFELKKNIPWCISTSSTVHAIMQ